jgi:hypothetical protein
MDRSSGIRHPGSWKLCDAVSLCTDQVTSYQESTTANQHPPWMVNSFVVPVLMCDDLHKAVVVRAMRLGDWQVNASAAKELLVYFCRPNRCST